MASLCMMKKVAMCGVWTWSMSIFLTRRVVTLSSAARGSSKRTTQGRDMLRRGFLPKCCRNLSSGMVRTRERSSTINLPIPPDMLPPPVDADRPTLALTSGITSSKR